MAGMYVLCCEGIVVALHARSYNLKTSLLSYFLGNFFTSFVTSSLWLRRPFTWLARGRGSHCGGGPIRAVASGILLEERRLARCPSHGGSCRQGGVPIHFRCGGGHPRGQGVRVLQGVVTGLQKFRCLNTRLIHN